MFCSFCLFKIAAQVFLYRDTVKFKYENGLVKPHELLVIYLVPFVAFYLSHILFTLG